MSSPHPNPDLIALGIRQPWAELILRGVKTIEVRSQDTRVRGPIYVYTSKKLSDLPAAWDIARAHHIEPEDLPRGVLVGTVEIHGTAPATPRDAAAACVPPELLQDRYGWHLRHPHRLPEPLTVRFLPYGVWFYPFKRKHSSGE